MSIGRNEGFGVMRRHTPLRGRAGVSTKPRPFRARTAEKGKSWESKKGYAQDHTCGFYRLRIRMVGAREARERGLKWVRTIRAEAAQHPSRAFWVVNELVLYDSGEQGWRYMRERPWPGEPWQTVKFPAQEAACAAAGRVNREIKERLAHEKSERLKREKDAAKLARRIGEEDLMRAAAITRHKGALRVPTEAITGEFAAERHRDEIVSATQEMPYLRHIYCRSAWPERLYVSDDGLSWRVDWTDTKHKFGPPQAKAREVGRRAQVAEGFGFEARANWGQTKAAIRRILKPRANELLEQASVRRLLDEALANGRKCLIWGNVAFWYEETGLTWKVLKVGQRDGAERGDIIWYEGTILSINHGRIIVLPYRKADGTEVSGHTKNSKADGPARPRHPSQYVEIPFERLDGDTMVGLHGELPYE